MEQLQDDMPLAEQQFLRELYEAFNKREVEAVLALMQLDVQWANGLHGGFVFGREQVRDDWREQFKSIQPQLEALRFEMDEEERYVISVHQIVCGLERQVLLDTMVGHRFTMQDGLIARFDSMECEPVGRLDDNDNR